MPTYEYLCKCGEEFEVLQSITEKPGAKCPVCGKQARRQVSAGAGLIFKGSGFYITDYKNKNAAKSESNGSNGAAAKSETAGESKGAAASDVSSAKPKSESKPATEKAGAA